MDHYHFSVTHSGITAEVHDKTALLTLVDALAYKGIPFTVDAYAIEETECPECCPHNGLLFFDPPAGVKDGTPEYDAWLDSTVTCRTCRSAVPIRDL